MDVPLAVRERVLLRVCLALAWDAPLVLAALGWPAVGVVAPMPAPRSQSGFWPSAGDHRANWSLWDLERDADCVAAAAYNGRVIAGLPVTVAQLARALRGVVGRRAVAVWTLAARALERDPPEPTLADRAAPLPPVGDAALASAEMAAWATHVHTAMQAALREDSTPAPIAGLADEAAARLAPPLRDAKTWGPRTRALVGALASDASPPIPATALATALDLCAGPAGAAAEAGAAVLDRAVVQGVSAHELATAFARLQRPDLVDAVVWHLLRLPVATRARRDVALPTAEAPVLARLGPLPPELGLRILAELAPADLVNSARRVCRAWRHLVALLVDDDRRHAFTCAAADWRRHAVSARALQRLADTASNLQHWPDGAEPPPTVWCTCGQKLDRHVAISLLSIPANPPNGGLTYADIHPRPLPVARWARLRPARDVALALHAVAMAAGLDARAAFHMTWCSNRSALLPFTVYLPLDVVRPASAAELAALAQTVLTGMSPWTHPHNRAAAARALASDGGNDGGPEAELWERLSDREDAADWYNAARSHEERSAVRAASAGDADDQAWRDAWRTVAPPRATAAAADDDDNDEDATDAAVWDPNDFTGDELQQFEAQHPEYATTVTAALEAADASKWLARRHAVRAGVAFHRYATAQGVSSPPVRATQVAAIDRLQAAFEAHCVLATSVFDVERAHYGNMGTGAYFVGLTRSGDLAGLWSLMGLAV